MPLMARIGAIYAAAGPTSLAKAPADLAKVVRGRLASQRPSAHNARERAAEGRQTEGVVE